MFTKEQLINFGAEQLAETILFLYKNNPDIEKQLELTFARFDSDPKKMISMISIEIESLKDSFPSRFDDYSYSDHLYDQSDRLDDQSDAYAKQVNQVRIHIMEGILPKSPDQAIELLLNLLDIYEDISEEVYGNIMDIFKQACADLSKAFEYTTNSLNYVVDIVYNRFMNNAYDLYNEIIRNFKDLLADNGLSLLKQKLEKSVDHKNNTRAKQGLEDIADCQNDVDAYIKACSFYGKPHAHEHLEIAKRLIIHCRGIEAIQWLDSIDITGGWQEKKRDLKIQALDLCGDYKAAQAERLNWFKTTLSPKVYSEILKYAEVDFIESFRKTAIQRALKFPNPYVALTFLREIQEFEQAAELVRLKYDTLDGGNGNYYTLRPIADVLCKTDPLAATLLYRVMIEPILIGAKSKYYYWAAKDLATCHSLSSKITDWQEYKNHQLYFEELSIEHNRKRSFWPEYTLAQNKRLKM